MPKQSTNNTVKIILEEEFIKQQILNLYAKLKGNTHGINKPHADESSARDFEKEIFRACRCALKKKKNHNVKIILEKEFIKQPFLKLYAKLKGSTNGINKPHADEWSDRDFEKEMFPCESMCLKKEKTIKSKSY